MLGQRSARAASPSSARRAPGSRPPFPRAGCDPPVEEHDPGRDLLCLRELLRRQQDGAAGRLRTPRGRGAARGARPRPSPRSARRGRGSAVTCESERDGEPSSLAARETGCVTVGRGREVEPREDLLRGRRIREVCANELDRLAHAETGRKTDVLEHRSDRSSRIGIARLEPAEGNATRVRSAQSEHDRDGSRLPGAVRAEQGDDLARSNFQVDPVERPHRSERLGHALEEGQRRCLGHGRFAHRAENRGRRLGCYEPAPCRDQCPETDMSGAATGVTPTRTL